LVTAIYPGTFDPVTWGHIDIIRRGSSAFDRLIVCVAQNPGKNSLFSLDERLELIQGALGETPVEVKVFDGLLVDAARQMGANVILRGLRAVSDFDYEFQMAHMNHQLASDVETVFLMTGEAFFYLSSGLVKEVASLNGDIQKFVPANVAKALQDRLSNPKKEG